jgi:hypothetical protein
MKEQKMLIKTNKLIGPALDCVVAKCEGVELFPPKRGSYVRSLAFGNEYHPSGFWQTGGPIIERERITISDWPAPNWRAYFTIPRKHPTDNKRDPSWHSHDGPTPLVAAMRCYVASVLGDEVDIPEELFE